MKYIKQITKKLIVCKQLTDTTYVGEISINNWTGTVVFSYNENNWEHVSVSPYGKVIPTWDDMCQIKDIFWNDEEPAIQVHPRKSEYINIQENCLHLWSRPDILVP